MKIVVFGATGRVGKSIVEKGIKEGHQIIAFVRDVNKLRMENPNLSIVEGDIQNREQLREISRLEFDAAINVIGADPLKPSLVFTESTKSIIDMLNNSKSKRYIAITGTAQMSKTLLGKLTIFLLRRTPVRHGIRDHQYAYDLVAHSDLNWTLIGCPYIKDGDEKRTFKTSTVFPGGFKTIHPGDVAQAILNELGKLNYRQIIGIWY